MLTEKVALKGYWVSFTHLVVTTKPFLSAAALTWISTLLKFSWLKRPNPIFISYLLMQLTPLLEKEACVGPDDPPHAISEETFMTTSENWSNSIK